MAGIYIMAFIATVVAAGIWVLPCTVLAGIHRRLALLTLLSLPFSALINLLVKTPALKALSQAFGYQSSIGPPPFFWMCCLFTAPLTEEAIKAVPCLIPPLRRLVRARGAAFWSGLFLGLGFGLGEIWYLAWSIAQMPEYAGLAWWDYTGFLTERTLVTLIHGIMTAVVVTGIARGRRQGWIGFVSAMGLHAFTNLGAVLYQANQIPVNLAGAWIFLPFTLLVLLFIHMYRQNQQAQSMKGWT